MEAPKPISYSFIKKELTSEQGQRCTLQISFTNHKFEFIVDKKGKMFNDRFKKEYSLNQIQENKYFILFEKPEEILEELSQKIDLKNPILTEKENNSMNLIIFLQNSKFKQAEFNLIKENFEINKNSEDFKSIIEKLYDSIEELKKENKEIKLQNEKSNNSINELKNEINSLKLQNENLVKRLTQIENKSNKVTLKKNNFHWINDEVDIIDNSKFTQLHPPNIMLGKNKSEPYSLTEGNRNHFVEFSFKNIYYLKSIRISVDNYECSLRNFKIEIKSPKGEKINLGDFTRSKYKDNTGFEEFQINRECKGLKLYLIDNWGSGGGNFILIKRIDFNVSD